MHTFKPNLAFAIIISLCCSVAIGSPPSGAGHSELPKDSKLFPVVIKKETGTFTIEEILSPKKYITRYLETAKKEGLPEKSPDREHQQIVVEKGIPSTAGEKDAHPTVSPKGDTTTPVAMEQSLVGEEKGTQTPTGDNMPLQAVTEEKTLSPPAVVKEKGIQELPADGGYQLMNTEKEISADNQKTDVHSIPTMPGSATTSAAEQQLPPVDESVTQGYMADNQSLPSLSGKVPSFPVFMDKKGYLEKYLSGEGHQPGVSFSETLQETIEEIAPMTRATPELQSEVIAGGEPLPVEAQGTQTLTVEDKSLLTTDENVPTFTPAEESSYTAAEESPDVLIEEGKEPEKGIPSPEPLAETGKEAEDSKPTWDIWHKDPTHGVILAVAITLIAAKIAEWIARMLRLPAVVGNLIIGMLLGNIFTFTGWDFFHFLRTMPFLKMVSYFGTLLLLFTAGLNTDLRALLRVGASSFLVCLGGVIAPAGLGFAVGHFFLPDTSTGTKLLLAILLCNTSTGLLLAVLSELKAIHTLEGRVLAGATILTDIVVILTFGVVSGFVAKGGVSLVGMSVSFGIAIASLIISLLAILRYGEKFGNFLTRRLTEGLNIPIVVISSLLLAFMFGSVGLHTVIGAFVAGLFLRNVKLRNSDDGEHSNVESFVRPFYMLLVPILFVRVGAQVELESFFSLNAVLLGLAITGASVIGKMFCGVCPIEKGINRLAIGIGMVTKMEGTLILAGIGRDMGILNDTVFSSVIMAIVLTSTICPSLLRLLLLKKGVHRKDLHSTAEKKELEEVVLN
jgi:Kef-type K+ transport system membrane component KefB